MAVEIRKGTSPGAHRAFAVEAPWERVYEVLGEGWVDDDPDKVDHSYHVIDIHTRDEAWMWNYKNGPAYTDTHGTRKRPMQDVDTWSACGSADLLQRCLSEGVEIAW